MSQNEQPIKKIPFELARKYLDAAGYPSSRVFKYKVFLKLFMDLVESSSFPVTITRTYQQDDLVSANTMLSLTCNRNNCNAKFNFTILKLFDDYLNYGVCCPKCRLRYRNEQEELARKVLERDSQYENINPYAGDAFSWEEPDLYIKRKTVRNKETGLYETIERTPQEIAEYKKKLEADKQAQLMMLQQHPEEYEKLRKKRKEIEGNSRRFRKEAMIQALNNDFELKLDQYGGGSYGSSKSSEGVSVDNTQLSLNERIYKSGENSGVRNVLSDKGYDDLADEIMETHGENISKDKIWDAMARDFLDEETRKTMDAGNIYNENLDNKLDSPL